MHRNGGQEPNRAIDASAAGPRPVPVQESHGSERTRMIQTNVNQEARATAQRWFARLLAPDCSVDERAEFERWRTADPMHAVAYQGIEGIWRRSEVLRNDAGIAAALREARRPASARRKPGWSIPLAIAASLLLVVGFLFRQQILPDNAPEVRFVTAMGEQRTVTLEDGSVAVIDTESELLVRYGRSERTLTLQRGRADFQVHPNPQRPFVVHAANGTVTATGTQFQVQVERDIGIVTLLEGKVHVAASEEKAAPTVTLTPGQRVAMTRGTLGPRHQLSDTDLASIHGWTEGNLVVKDTPLAQVVEQMNQYSRTKLRLEGNELGEIPVSGVFKVGDQQSLAMALEYGWSVHAEHTNGEIVLRKK